VSVARKLSKPSATCYVQQPTGLGNGFSGNTSGKNETTRQSSNCRGRSPLPWEVRDIPAPASRLDARRRPAQFSLARQELRPKGAQISLHNLEFWDPNAAQMRDLRSSLPRLDRQIRILTTRVMLSRLKPEPSGGPCALGSGIRTEAPLAPSLATFDRPAATPGT
jgi:hypothetical protein